ncbi:MAG: hypothetical protein ACFFG0_37235 [Candidatus Thorarchaeota archaeon]
MDIGDFDWGENNKNEIKEILEKCLIHIRTNEKQRFVEDFSRLTDKISFIVKNIIYLAVKRHEVYDMIGKVKRFSIENVKAFDSKDKVMDYITKRNDFERCHYEKFEVN